MFQQKITNMKKLHLILAFAFTMMIGSAFAQNVAVGGATGITILASKNTNLSLPITSTVEWGFKDNMSLAGDIGGEIGLGKGNGGFFYFSPEYRYHTNQVFDGFYVGGFLGVGGGGFGNYVGVGATLGYQLMVMENFNIDIHGQAGFGSGGAKFGGGRTNGFHLRPTVGLRYVFNNK